MNIAEFREHLCAIHPELCPLFSVEFGDGVLTIEREGFHQAMSDLKDLGFDRFTMVTAVDRTAGFELVYRVKSRSMSAALFVKCLVEREGPVIASVVDLWPSADWQEREVYDLFGIIFEGHPDLRRILLPTDFEGFPLRKDYVDSTVIRRPDYI
ncbi:MAG: NADH-quinone oxidoreductase subunit C [Coriobacteriia bacterium]|jgi:NADH-quinone oxidoreductase subunit C|nr:NADH-quinone oxidoreductase subunit C [Coriobacteriia bacterium]